METITTIKEYEGKTGTVHIVRYTDATGREVFHVKHTNRVSLNEWFNNKCDAIKYAQFASRY